MFDGLNWLWVAVLIIVIVPPTIISMIMFLPDGDEDERADDESDRDG